MSSRVVGYAPWAPREATRVVLAQVAAVLAEYRAQWPLTVRQIFYRLVGAHGFPKDELAYGRLQEYMNRGRRAGMVPWEAIRDDGASSDDPSWRYTDLTPDEWFQFGLPRAVDYLAHPQEGQPVFTEVWCEAGGMVPMLARAVLDRGIPVYSGGGFDSVTSVRGHALRHQFRDDPTRVLYVGDYDPSGEAMFARLGEDVAAFGSEAEWVRVAVRPEHIEEFALPTAPPKATDRRSAFTDTRTVQAEALPPDVLLRLVTDAVEVGWDADAAEAGLAAQELAQERIEELRQAVDDMLADDGE